MAQRDQVGRLLRGHYACDASNGKHVALRGPSLAHQLERRLGERDVRARHCYPLCRELGAHVYHARVTLLVEVCQAGRGWMLLVHVVAGAI